MELASCGSSSSDLIGRACYDLNDLYMVEDLDAPGGAGQGGLGMGPSRDGGQGASFRAGASGPFSASSQQTDLNDVAPAAQSAAVGGSAEKARFAAIRGSRTALWSGSSAATASAPSNQLEQLTKQLRGHQSAQGLLLQAPSSGSFGRSGSSNATGTPAPPGSRSTSMEAPTQPGAAAATASTAAAAGQAGQTPPPSGTRPSLTHALSLDACQRLLAAGADPTMLMAAFNDQQAAVAAQRSSAAIMAPPTPQPAPALTLETAENLWQQVAATGADDQTLLSLAASLGLISTDGSGNVVLAREAAEQTLGGPSQSAAAAAAMLGMSTRGPCSAPVHAMSPGAGYAPAHVEAAAAFRQASQSGKFGTAARQHASFEAAGSTSVSSPLPTLSPSALADILSTFDALRTVGHHGQAGGQASGSLPKGLGSPVAGPSKQHTLYKTELCRGWLETGTCRYGSKCQFAHGPEDLRPVPRHPKYKTEVCRSFTATGLCAYGNRCRFIHGCTSAPHNAFVMGPEGTGPTGTPPHRMSDGFGMEGLEGVLTLEDPSPRQAPMQEGGWLSPRSRLLLALNGGAFGLRPPGQPSQAPQSDAHDAAVLAKLGFLMGGNPISGRRSDVSLPGAADGRASIESMPCGSLVGGAGSSIQCGGAGTMGRSSIGDTQRSSMESRTGGRTSLESSQSQQEWAVRDMSSLDGQTLASPQKGGARVGGGAAGTVGDVYGSVPGGQRYGMPGIPEGSTLTSLGLGNRGWRGNSPSQRASLDIQGVAPGGMSKTTAAAAAQLAAQMQYNFSMNAGAGMAGGQPPQAAAAAALARGFAQQLVSGAPGLMAGAPSRASMDSGSRPAMPNGAWYTAPSSARPSFDGEASQNAHNALLMSAYSSGLYAMSTGGGAAGHGQGQGARRQSPASNPGLPTPERSDPSIAPSSDVNLAALLGL